MTVRQGFEACDKWQQPDCWQVAEVQLSNRAMQSMTSEDSLIVEMPGSFCVDGDAGSIGRFVVSSAAAAQPGVCMDIKGKSCW